MTSEQLRFKSFMCLIVIVSFAMTQSASTSVYNVFYSNMFCVFVFYCRAYLFFLTVMAIQWDLYTSVPLTLVDLLRGGNVLFAIPADTCTLRRCITTSYCKVKFEDVVQGKTRFLPVARRASSLRQCRWCALTNVARVSFY